MSGAEVQRLNQVLPEDFADRLRALYARGRSARSVLCAVIVAANERGWTLKAMADAIGVSRERVRQLAAMATGKPDGLFAIPQPPTKPEPFKRILPQLTDEQAEQLRDLHRQGQASGMMAADHPAVVASCELSRLLNEYLKQGHRLIDLARTLGVTKMAVHFRLGHHGYRRLAPSQRYAPGPIAARAKLEVSS